MSTSQLVGIRVSERTDEPIYLVLFPPISIVLCLQYYMIIEYNKCRSLQSTSSVFDIVGQSVHIACWSCSLQLLLTVSCATIIDRLGLSVVDFELWLRIYSLTERLDRRPPPGQVA